MKQELMDKEMQIEKLRTHEYTPVAEDGGPINSGILKVLFV